MNKNKKILRTLGAYLLAAMFLLHAILELLPPLQVNAAVTMIEEWDENQLTDYKHRFNIKYQPGITTIETFGCDNQDYEALSNHGRNGLNVDTKRMTGEYVPGSAGIRYNNVGKDGDGNIVDFQLSVMEVSGAEPRYDMFTPYTKYHLWKDELEDNGDGYDWENGIGQPVVGFFKGPIGIVTYCIGSVKVRYQFFKHGTNEPLAISGHGTVRDLDAGQGLSIPEDSNLDHAYILKGNNFLEVNGTSVKAGDGSLESYDKRGWINMLYNTDTIYFNFLHQSRLDRWDQERADGIEKRGSEEKWAKVLRDTYVDPDGKSYCSNFDGGKIVRGHAFFDFTSYCLGGVEMKKQPEKRVGEVGCSWEEGIVSTEENPFPIYGFEEFQYMIQTEVTPNHFREFVVQDTLKNCLAIDGTSKVIIKNDVGEEVTGQFDIRIDGQTITCAAKEDFLQEESFTDNQVYTFFLRVHRKEDGDVSDFLKEDGYTFCVPNNADMTYVRVNGKGETMTTDTVWVTGKILPDLVTEKRVSKYEWKVGDEIDYTVKVTQKKPNAWAINTVVEDLTLPPSLSLIDGQYFVETSPGVEHCVINKEGENGWRVTCPLLQYDESIQIIFRCVATEASNGKEWTNTAAAKAENYIDEKTGEPKESKDLAEVWVNSPDLQIEKTADKYEWRVGDQVRYRVVVTNEASGTIAKDVNISDMELPEGLVLSGGSNAVEIVNAPTQIEYPVPDKKTGIAHETREVESYLNADERGWNFYCSYLPYSQPVTILFHCTATEACNGRENINVASVSAGNAQEKTDDAEAYVNTGNFWIEKTADHYEWQVGESVEYQVVVKNQIPGTIARNVTIWDTSMPSGLALTSPDSVRIEGIPDTFEDPVAGTEDPKSQLNPELYQETVTKQISYEFVPEGTGWRLNLSDLPADMPVTIRFLCTATDTVNGVESINAASVRAENAPEETDDAEVYVNTAVLSIDKVIHNPYLELGDGRMENEFRVGEQVEYEVIVNNLQKGSIARNLTVSDLSLPEGLVLDPDESALTVSGIPQTILNPVGGTDDMGNQLDPENYGEVQEKPVEYRLVREGTGWSLFISDLPWQTPVSVRFRCTVMENLNGWEIINTATASAQNGAEVKDSAKIWVNTPVLKIEKNADKPTYKYGDIATYTMKIYQMQPGCVARNVVISDLIDTPGVRLLKDSIVLLDENGNLVDAVTEANEDNTFRVLTGRSLVNEKPYCVFDSSQGGAFEQVMQNPLQLSTEKVMTVEYQMAVVDENLAGKIVHNKAIVDSDEHYPAEDEETVEIHSPVLDIVKESDKKEYHVGETGYYKLTVRQLREDVTARNITIQDYLSNPGAVLLPDSILVKLNNQVLENAVIEQIENGFQVKAGIELSDTDKLEIFYKVFFESETLDNTSVVNTAKAKGENTPEEIQEHEVYVGDIRPLLVIEKESDKNRYLPGQTGHYFLKITQAEKDAVARNVVIKDLLQDKNATIITESIKVYDKKGVELDKPEIESTEKGYTIYTGMELSYQEYLTVEYDVLFSEEIKEEDILNVGMVTADNMKPEEEAEPDPVSVGDGLVAWKTSDPPSGSIVKEGETIAYFIHVKNTSSEKKENIMIKDTLPQYTKFDSFGENEGKLLELDEKEHVGFFIKDLAVGEEKIVSFSVIKENTEKENCIVNVAQVRESLVKEDDVTEETWKSQRFFNTNSTVHYGDTIWNRTEHEVEIGAEQEALSPTPEPTATVTPSPQPTVTVSPTPTTKVPTPTTASCPKISSAPTRPAGGTYQSNSSYPYSSGTASYGAYQSGGYTGTAKTGDERPFDTMLKITGAGIVLLGLGVLVYRRNKEKKK